jgi:hypothetical protein
MKRFKAGLVLGVAVWVLSACVAQGPRVTHDAERASAPQPSQVAQAEAAEVEPTRSEAARDCVAQGGRWKPLGFLGRWQCERALSDAGQACRDGSDCQGECLAPAGSDIDQPVLGQCAAVAPLFGCHARVRQGKAEPMLCVD